MMNFNLRYFFSILATLLIISQFSYAQKRESSKKKEEQSKAQLLEAESFFTEGMKFYMMEDYDKAVEFYEKALAIVPDNSGILYALSNNYQKLKDENKAILYAEKAFQLNNENEAYGELLADLYVRKQKYDAAARVYQNLIALNPSKSEFYVAQAAVYIFDNHFDEALKAYSRAEKIIGINEEITRQKQMVLVKIGKVDEAIKEGEKLILSDPEEIDYNIDQAELLMSNKRNDQAIPYLEKILKMNPENAQAHIMLAQLYQEKGEIDKCNRELELAFADASLDATTKARILIGYMNMAKDEKSKQTAFNLVKVLIKANPQDPKSHAIYGDLLFQKGDEKSARDEYVKAARLDKSINEVWGNIINIDFKLRQIDSAIVHSEEAIEVFPNQSAFWYLNGSAYYQKRNHNKAAESLEEARRLTPTNSELYQHINALLGDTYNSLSKYQKSDEAYEAALKADPNNDHVLNNYSYFLSLRKDKLELAAEMGARLVEKHPDNGTYLDTYAWVLYVMKDYNKARIYLERAVVQNKSNSGTIVEHYGDVLFQLGEKEKAVEQWKKAKTIGTTSTLIDKKIAEMKLIE
ncbi:tetratricopeptide (TPR) repeat protein [Arcicella sp. BE140]|uniref:tetratricopeptide repeat protein n=2 Tax=Arcicella TaxID=217140 RepID=UPI00286405CF|nr:MULTISPECIES: tetratricopeptide repeat protein [unclassified Arcicella]MDR6563940.1 tetratricopeptide (TPR) repeat protein [Arcicella sp. BE51]MDR6813693.1 tetratricopeptide (TPR) repeat protein [Arcicella sp. BE140]MDR6824926.1 tetratricopeptide (TPR) repeat protein [Arcicella sp. BE139]